MRVLVRDVMSKGVLKLRKDQTIKEVNQLFLDRVIDGAPVVDNDGKVVGVFTKTHLMRAIGKPLDTPIEWLMNKNVISIGETMPVEEAMNIPVGRLPVVDKEGKMVGWLTRTDLASAFMDHYKKSIEGLSKIIDLAVYGILAINPEGKINVFNRKAEELWGINAENIIGQSVGELFPALEMEAILRKREPRSGTIIVDEILYKIEMNPIIVDGELRGAVSRFSRVEE